MRRVSFDAVADLPVIVARFARELSNADTTTPRPLCHRRGQRCRRGARDHALPANAPQSLGYKIRYAYRAFVKALAEELGPHRVTTGQWSALRVLWEEEGLSQVELAQRMMVEKASLTAVLKGDGGREG